MLELRALGNAEIVTDKATLTPSQEIVFASALYLILERKKRVSRTSLAEILWPKVDPATRSHRLRQTLLQLKKLGFPLRADNNTVGIRVDTSLADVGGLHALEKGVLPSGGPVEFLPGYSPRFSEPFRDWVDARRSELHSLSSQALLPVLREKRATGHWAEVEELARRSLTLDPLNESAVLSLAEASAMRGQKHEAVAILDRYLEEIGSRNSDIRLPATLLRSRISEAGQPNHQPVAEPGFIGREKELNQLTTYLAKAEKGCGSVSLILGDPGIGKSRLVLELARFAELQGVKVQRVACRHSDVDRPLSVFVDLVPQLRDLPGALGCSQETLVALKRLTEFNGSETTPPAFDDLSGVDRSIRNALFDLLDALVDEQCLLILVEDIHWLDRASAKIFAEMTEWATSRSLLVVFNARPGPSPLTHSVLWDDGHRIELPPIARSHAEELLRSVVRCRVPDPDTAVIEWMLSAGEGNPFFLQELAKHWIETGHLHDVPPSVATLLNTRLSRLSDDSLRVLQSCAVLGEHATLDRIEAVLEYKAHQILNALQELNSAGMLLSSGGDDQPAGRQLKVRHDLVSIAALGSLGPLAQTYLHRRIGSVLERELSGARSRTSLLWAAAFHWGRAGDSDKALSVAQSCAEHLLEIGLPSDAVAAFEKAAEYCRSDETRLTVLSRLVLALQMNGQWEKSRVILLACRDLRYRIAPDANVHDDLEVHLYDARWRASLEHTSLLRELVTCAESPAASPSHRISCGLLGLKVGSNLGALEAMRRLYSIVEPLLGAGHGDHMTQLEIEMVFHSICGDVERALDGLDSYLDVVRNQRTPLTVCRGLMNAAFACRIAGRRDDAISLLSECVQHALNHKLHERAAANLLALVNVFLASSEIEKAQEAMDRANSLYQLDTDATWNADRDLLCARLAFEERDYARAALLFNKVEAIIDSQQGAGRRAAVLALAVQIGIKTGLPQAQLQALVRKLHAAHLLTRETGCQDFEAFSLFLGMRSIGEPTCGKELLIEYAAIHRREKWTLPTLISEAIN